MIHSRSAKENIPIIKPVNTQTQKQNSMASSSASSSSNSQSRYLSISPNYLLSPLETLDESLSDQDEQCVDLHDLTEAYNVLATRLKHMINKDLDSDQALSAITLIRERSRVLVDALRRDSTRLMVNPCISHKEMGVDEVQYASDLATLGQQALLVISELFSFTQLREAVSGDQLRLLLGDVLLLLSQPSLPTPQSRRTFALLRFILKVQKLPVNVLAPHKSKIIASVKRGIHGKTLHEQIDGLMILTELLRSQPKPFLGPACDFLPKVLQSLVVESSKIRFAAAHALSAFASAKVAHGLVYEAKVSYELSRVVRRFLEDSSKHGPILSSILESACNVSQVVFEGEGPQWASVVMASFIVLIDHPIFHSKAALATIKDPLYDIAEHKSHTVRRLSGPVWRCFVWAFSRVSPEEKKSREVQEYLSQDYRSGTGASTCCVLLGFSNSDAMIDRVVEVVGVMLKESRSQPDGLFLLCQLLSDQPPDASSSHFDAKSLLDRQLFNGEILKSDLPSLSKVTPRYNADVRPLSVQQMIVRWDKLHKFWTTGVKLILRDPTPDIPKAIFTAWKMLLIADLELSQIQGHLAPTSKLVHRLGALCIDFASTTTGIEEELKQIHLLHGLLTHVQHTFPQSNLLEEAVDLLLSAVVRRDFRISDSQIQVEWLGMCQELVTYPARNADGKVVERRLSEFNMQTWVAIARKWIGIDGVAGDGLITFLKFPFPEQLTTDEEIELWGMLFRTALAAAKAQGNTTQAAISLWHTLVADGDDLPLAFPKQFHALFSAFVTPFENETLAEQVLPFMNTVLSLFYPPGTDLIPNHALTTSLRYIATIYDMILSVPDTFMVSCLGLVSSGLSRWLEDKSHAVPDQIYFENIFPLYQEVLKRLRKERPDEKTLTTLWGFFVAPLDGPGSRAKGVYPPFEEFWLATYHKRPEFIRLYEADLKMVLKGIASVDNRGFAAELTQSDNSQRTASIVPETQPLETVPITGSQALARYCDTVGQLENDNIRSPDMEIVPSSSPIRGLPLLNSGPMCKEVDTPMAVHDPHQDQENTSSFIGKKRKRPSKQEEIVEASQDPPSIRSRVSRDRGDADVRSVDAQVPKPSSKDKGKAKATQQLPQTPVKRDRTIARKQESQLMTPEPSAPSSSHGHGYAISVQHSEENEDYEDWEKETVSPGSFAQISRELGTNNLDVDADYPDPNDDGSVLHSPSFRLSKRRKTKSPVTTAIDAPSGRTRGRAPSAKVIQLRQALQALEDDPKTSMDELIKASRLAQEFGLAVNKKIASWNQSKWKQS